MSVIEEDLLAPRITKRSAIKVLVVASLLISLFVFSTFVYALILGTQRRDPSERLEDADKEDATLVFIPPPWNFDDIKELLEDFDINITELAEETGLPEEVIEEYLEDVIPEMLDGNIDDLDLTSYGAAIAALLFSEAEVFRVYDYDEFGPFDLNEDVLWKYECFDEFSGDGWHNTEIPEINDDYFNYEDEDDGRPHYYFDYTHLDLIKIQRSFPSPNIGQNSFVIGTLFRQEDPTTPFIIKESIDAPNLEEDETFLYKDALGGNTAQLTFTSSNPVNMTYDIFGQDLLTNAQVNNSAVQTSFTPSSILNQFTQLPPNVNDYLNDPSHDDIKFHYDILDTVIDQNNDNAFKIANIIRNYIQDPSVFTVGYYELLNNGPADGEDVVEWFCEHREGSSSEFASAFNVFCRAFGVASRFVDGFNCYNISEDPSEEFYAIKWKNIYNWAEIYVPFSASTGTWVQMDVLRDSFGEGGNPLTDFNLTVESEFMTYSRPNQPDQANITATLSSATRSVNGLNINFYDETIDPDVPFDTVPTDFNGKASTFIDINDAQVAGPHVIRAEYGPIENYTYYIVDEPIRVDFISATPQQLNVSISPAESLVVGYLRDNKTNDGIPNAEINFVLLQKGTNNRIMNAFVDEYTYTNVNGYFNTLLSFRDTIPYGEYDLRADFNGTWGIPIDPYSITYSNINDSSDTIDFNITKERTFNVLFSIDGRPSEYPNPFIDTASLVNAKRGQPLNLSVVVYDPETSSVVPNQIVNFYDYTNGDVPIGSNITDSNGIAWLNFTPDTTIKAGPNLLYARSGGGSNYSYYILNELIQVNLISGPFPTTINITSGIGSTQFNIQGNITDEVNNPISYAEINLRLLRGGLDYSGFLIPSQSYITLLDGSFNLWFRVQDITPIGNYSLRMDFNGTFAFEDPNDSNNPYKYRFNLISLSNASPFQNELRVFDPDRIEIDLSVEGYPTTDLYDDSYRPQIYKSGEEAHFQVNVTQSGGYPAPGSYVYIYDVYDEMTELGFYQFGPSNGFVQFNISIDSFTFAGIHEIRVQYESFTTINTTFIIINETISFNPLKPYISHNVIQRDDSTLITISGLVEESGQGMRGLWVRLLLFDKNYNNVSHYLIGGNTYALTDASGSYTFNNININSSCPQGPYYIRVDFNETIEIPGVPGIDLIPNYMINVSSDYVDLNITADTDFANINYYTDYHLPGFWTNDTCHVVGNLRWDNGSGLEGVIVNATVKNGAQIIAINSSLTIIDGAFEINFVIGDVWDSDITKIYISFYYPIDTIGEPEAYYIEQIIELEVSEQP